ncbi:hypothetical protein Nmel_017517 [Mimus melanotis]
MGRQRAPPEPCWRRLLRAAGCGLLSLCGTALRGLRGLWSLTWVGTTQLLPQGPPRTSAGSKRGRSQGRGLVPGAVWAQLPMDLRVPTVRVGFQLGTALQLRLEGSEEEEDVDSDSAWEPGQTGQWRGNASEAVLGRLEALEADVRFLCTELGAEKLLWSSRFLDLLREQQSLRQRVSVSARGCQPHSPPDTPDPHTLFQLQELPWQWNSADSPDLLGEAEDQSASGSEGESPEGRQWMEAPQQPRGSIQPNRQKM